MSRLFKKQPLAIDKGKAFPDVIAESEPTKGIPAVPSEAILIHFHDHIEELRKALAFDADLYEEIVVPVIRRYAQKTHLLPASESHHHSGTGGLFQHSLEVAIKARRRADDFLYGRDKPPQLRGDVETAWRLAIGLAGLFHDNGKILTDYRVINCSGELLWNPYVEDLDSWAILNGCTRYFLIWNPRRIRKHEDAATHFISEWLGPACTHFLTRHDDGPLLSLYQTLIGRNSDERFGELIRWADHASVAADLKGHRFSRGLSIGRRKDELILEAIKALLQESIWTTQGDSPLVQKQDGDLLIDWFQAQPSLIRKLKEMSPVGWHEDADGLAEILIERGYANLPTGTTVNPDRYWLQNHGNRTVRILRLSVTHLSKLISVTQDISLPESSDGVMASASIPIRDGQMAAESWIERLPCSTEIREILYRLHQSIELTHVRRNNHQVWVPYPDAFKALGLPPVPSLKYFQNAGLLQLDAKTGLKAVLELEGERGFLFTKEASDYISSIWPIEPTAGIITTELTQQNNAATVAPPPHVLADAGRLFSPERLRAIALIPNEK